MSIFLCDFFGTNFSAVAAVTFRHPICRSSQRGLAGESSIMSYHSDVFLSFL